MKLNTLIGTIFLSAIFSLTLSAQCSITNLSVISQGCDINGMVNLEFDFDVINPGSNNTFDLFINGSFRTEYDYGQDSYSYGLLWGDCETIYSISIIDSNESDCSADFTFAEPFCCWDEGCNMILDVDVVGECNDEGDFYITLLVANPGGSGGGFETVINGVSFGWIDYGATTYEYGPLDGDCETIYEINVTDFEDEECTLSTVLNSLVCCSTCDDLTVDFIGQNNCTGSGTFFTELLIDNPGSTNFEVFINEASQGIFDYGDEVYSFGPLQGDCSSFYTIEIIDLDLGCVETVYLDALCCPEYCSISDIMVEAIACTSDETFAIELNFNYAEVEENNFDFWANGSYHGTYAYSDLPIIISNFPVNGNDDPFVTIFGIGTDALCADDLVFQGLDCNEDICTISNVYAEEYNCNDEGQIFIDIEFMVSQPGPSNQFTINGNGINYGTFEYGQTFYTVGPFTPDCSIEYEFIITDIDNNTCSDFFVFADPLCCEIEECEIHTLDFGANPICQNGLIVTEWLIDGDHLSEIGYDIYVNDEYETFVEWNNNSWYDFDIEDPGTEIFTLRICDNDNDECCIQWELENPCFDNSLNECSINGVEAEAFCNDNGLFADVWFTYENPGNANQFNIAVNDQEFGPFEYGEDYYTVGPMDFPCDQSQFITVSDVNDANCLGFFNLETADNFCCTDEECVILNLNANSQSCNEDGQIYFDISFEINNPGTDNQFTVVGNGNNYGTFEYGEDVYTVGPFNADCITAAELILTDVNNNDCSAIVEFDEIFCCEDQSCEITTLDFGPNPICQNGLIITEWLIDGVNLSEVGYDIYINNTFLTFVQWNNDAWYQFDIENPETELFTIRVCDNDNDDCCIEWELENPCFEGDIESCSLTDINVEAQDCNDIGEIYFNLSFSVNNPGTDNQFTVVGNGNNYGTFEYGEDVYTVGPFNADCVTAAELILTDVNNNDCSAIVEFDEIFCCEDQSCEITTLDFGPNPICQNGLIITEWLIDGVNLSEVGYDIYINNTFLTFVQWNNDAWYQFDIENPETELFTIRVCDNDNDDCCIEWELENPCFEEDIETCSLADIIVEAQDCNDIGEIYFNLSFSVNNPGTDNQFTVVGNGNNYGTFEYGEDVYTVGPFNADCVTAAELILTDVNNNDCSAIAEFDEIFCCDEDTDDCTISGVTVEQQDCNDEDQIYFILTFNYSNPVSNQFTVRGNGNDYGSFEYGLESYEIGPVPADCETELEFIVIDNENDNCSAFVGHDPVCCEDETECGLTEISLETTECLGDYTFNLVIDAEVTDNTNDFFDLNINSEFIGFYEFEDLPITIEELSYDTEILSVQICENDNPECCLALDLENPCSQSNNPSYYLENVEVEFISCVDDLIMMSIDLDHGDNNNQFSVLANGISFGDFMYSQLPITIDGLPADGVTDYTLTIFDTSINDLSVNAPIGTLACEGDVILDSDDITLDPAKINSIQAYDITGRLLGNINPQEKIEILEFNGNVSSGIIILRIDYGDKILTKKIVRVH